MTVLDYAQLYETEYRPRRRRLARLAARALGVALFVLGPPLALHMLGWTAG